MDVTMLYGRCYCRNRGCIRIEHKMVAVRAVLLLLALAMGKTDSFSPQLPWRLAVVPSATRLSAIADEVTDEMKKAMKARDTATLGVIRLIRSSFANAAIDLKTEKLSDEQAQTVLLKMAKMRKESIDMFEKGGAMDRAEAERTELQVIGRWLPAQASEETMREWVKEAIAEAGTDNAGKVMGALMKKHKAEVDAAVAQKIIKDELSKP